MNHFNPKENKENSSRELIKFAWFVVLVRRCSFSIKENIILAD
jgi:hypothetical protein